MTGVAGSGGLALTCLRAAAVGRCSFLPWAFGAVSSRAASGSTGAGFGVGVTGGASSDGAGAGGADTGSAAGVGTAAASASAGRAGCDRGGADRRVVSASTCVEAGGGTRLERPKWTTATPTATIVPTTTASCTSGEGKPSSPASCVATCSSEVGSDGLLMTEQCAEGVQPGK